MALAEKIVCNGIKPKKSEVYALAAELQESEQIFRFKKAVIEALMSYDYEYYDSDYYVDYSYDYGDYNHNYACDDHGDYDTYDYNHDYSPAEKTLALLFLSAMYAAKGE